MNTELVMQAYAAQLHQLGRSVGMASLPPVEADEDTANVVSLDAERTKRATRAAMREQGF